MVSFFFWGWLLVPVLSGVHSLGWNGPFNLLLVLSYRGFIDGLDQNLDFLKS